MARKKVIDLDADQVLKFTEQGQIFEGHYIGCRKVKSDFGFSMLHVFLTDEGNQGLWGSAKLDAKLATVPPGCKTFITYEGKVKIPGGKTMHKYDVEYDDEDTKDVGNVSAINYQEEGAEDPEEEPAAKVTKGTQADSAAAEIDEQAAAEEDEATEGQSEEEAEAATPAVKTKPVSKGPVAAPSKASADKVSNLLSKRR